MLLFLSAPCTKHRVCHREAGSLGSNYQSAQTTYVTVSQGLAFLWEPAKFFACLELATGEWRMWGPRFLRIH